VPIETAREARDEARRLGADCAVAIGGGSTTGLGKAIALLDDTAAQAAALLTQAATEPLADRSRQRAGLVLANLALDALRRMRESRFAPRSLLDPPDFLQLWRAWRTARNP